MHSGQKGWQQVRQAAVPDCTQVGLVEHFVSLQAIDFYTLVIGYRYACVVLVESQIQYAFGRWWPAQRHPD